MNTHEIIQRVTVCVLACYGVKDPVQAINEAREALEACLLVLPLESKVRARCERALEGLKQTGE